MDFASDNWAGAAPRVMEGLAEAAAGPAPAYGADAWTARAEAALGRFFGRDVAAFFVATGSAANSLALAHPMRPGGVAFCHADAHVVADEAGAPGFLGGGLALERLPGRHGRIEAAALAERLALYPEAGALRHGRPIALSLTQATESGTCYRADEVRALADIAHGRGMIVHLDGARLASALAFLGAAPAELTWRAGVDVVSLGFTKTGAWCAEAVVFLDPATAGDFAVRRKTAGHLFSKSRLVAAQFLALLEDDHWRELAGHANRMAARLAEGVLATGRARLAWPCESNEVFLHLDRTAAERLRAEGANFYPWSARELAPEDRPAESEELVRLVTSFATGEDEVARFVERLAAG